jgi:hypothetical protein
LIRVVATDHVIQVKRFVVEFIIMPDQSYAFLGFLWILFNLWEADAAAAALRTLNVQGDKI